MKRSRRFPAAVALLGVLAAATTAVVPLTGCGAGGSNQSLPVAYSRVVGGTRSVSGAEIKTWADVRIDGQVERVGVTLPLAVVQNPPVPINSLLPDTLDLPMPSEVSSSTYINFVSLDYNPQGHPPPGVYDVPHFDIHFYAITPQQRNAILAPDPVPPSADRIPAGYLYPPPFLVAENTVPMMGVHASPASDFAPGAKFTRTMILGYYNGNMNFLEPMVTRELLLKRQSFSLPVPRPATLGRATRYPTEFNAVYDPAADSYDLVFSNFVSVTR